MVSSAYSRLRMQQTVRGCGRFPALDELPRESPFRDKKIDNLRDHLLDHADKLYDLDIMVYDQRMNYRTSLPDGNHASDKFMKWMISIFNPAFY
jgi:hypothetical protein